jgi:hypothetical protein
MFIGDQMRSTTRKLSLVPVWLLTLLLKPLLPQNHPWKHQWLTLESWAEKGTAMAVEFGVVFWIGGLTALYAIWFLLSHGFAAH